MSSPACTARVIPVVATVKLDHRAHYGRTCGAGFVLVSPDGVVTVVDERLRVVRRLDLGGAVADVAVSPDGTWAWVVDGELRVGDPETPDPMSVPVSAQAACRWSPAGDVLWVAHGTGDEVRVQVRAPDHRVLGEVTLPDEFGDASVVLCPHPDPDAVVLWVAAGQDGQQSWSVRAPTDTTGSTAGPTAELLPADDCLPALFGPDGTWLLTADDDRLVRRSWPGGAELGSLDWARVDPEAERDGGDMPGTDLLLLPGDLVVWSTGNGRLRTVDLAAMAVVDEVVPECHPVRTTAELYPSLDDDHSPAADFHYSVPGSGGRVLTVHCADTLVLTDLRDWVPTRS